jgi:hypothetical protein
MAKGEPLSNISETHPRRVLHDFYFPNAEFPELNLLPPSADRWWERLGKQLLLNSAALLTIFFNEKPKKPAGRQLPK